MLYDIQYYEYIKKIMISVINEYPEGRVRALKFFFNVIENHEKPIFDL